MDLIIHSWITAEASPLAVGLLIGSIAVGLTGFIGASFLYDSAHRSRKAGAKALAIATAAALAITVPISITHPRVDRSNAFTYIEATGTVESITPGLNRGGIGIRLTNNPTILLTIDESEADAFAGIEGHPTTVHCTTPTDVDHDHPALAAGTILNCSTTAHTRSQLAEELAPPAKPGTERTTTTPIEIP